MDTLILIWTIPHYHKGGDKPHDHFDRLGKQQRPMHHYTNTVPRNESFHL